MRNEKWVLYNWWWTTQLSDWEEAPKYFPKSNLHQKKVIVTVWWSVAGLITAFWILVKPLHLRSMLSKPMRCMETCNTYGQDWPTERAQLSYMTAANHMLLNQCFKIWTNWASRFCLIFHIHLTFCCQPTSTSSSILTTFAGKMLPQPAGGKKYFPRVHRIPKQGFLCYKNEQTYCWLAKMCWF